MTAIARTRALPEIVSIGNREIISTGQFNIALVADKIIRDGVNDWVSISELAKFVYGKSFLANNKRVRKYIWQMRRALLGRGFLLIHEGRPVEHVKLYVGGSEIENQLANKLIKEMHRRTDISKELYQTALFLLDREQQQIA